MNTSSGVQHSQSWYAAQSLAGLGVVVGGWFLGLAAGPESAGGVRIAFGAVLVVSLLCGFVVRRDWRSWGFVIAAAAALWLLLGM